METKPLRWWFPILVEGVFGFSGGLEKRVWRPNPYGGGFQFWLREFLVGSGVWRPGFGDQGLETKPLR
ncbi:hypothetical protein AFK68_17855 [Hydrocoleum sp. CS-953]|uniref:hypothetical protein n=1 Tax=Hydrocoleum sp. CS-953 TaxID=1671698 RepID=UPI000B9BB553|nr:hypothetical protein [Hydrocoleum sp. CS-953]OZH53401.1 hypothetical protein AFK68_17855 [Hydrocoleum sp. CS-953]